VPVFFPACSLSLSLSRGPRSLATETLPRAPPFFSLCAGGLPCQFRPLRARRGPTSAHSRTSPDFSAMTPAHTPSSLLRAPPVPRTHPHLISLSFTLSRALLTPPDAAGDPRPRSRPTSSPETAPSLFELRPKVKHLSPCPISSIAPCVWPISSSPVLGRGGPPCSRVAGRFSPV
jgi:hypothetical protein